MQQCRTGRALDRHRNRAQHPRADDVIPTRPSRAACDTEGGDPRSARHHQVVMGEHREADGAECVTRQATAGGASSPRLQPQDAVLHPQDVVESRYQHSQGGARLPPEDTSDAWRSVSHTHMLNQWPVAGTGKALWLLWAYGEWQTLTGTKPLNSRRCACAHLCLTLREHHKHSDQAWGTSRDVIKG